MRIGGFFRSTLVVFSALGLVCCGSFDGASFRPAKGSSDQPALKESFRVKAVAPDCVLLGYINAEGDRAVEYISSTAANHGANSYLVVNENRDVRVATGDNNELRSHTNRKLLAEAYRCPMSDDLPK
jgi:hypothetical protein